MEPISLKEIVEATKGTLPGKYQEHQDIKRTVRRVETDSRAVKEGDLFFALIGEKMDGHRFVKAALENGAEGAVVSREPAQEEIVPGKFYVLVEDTTAALGDLAKYYRSRFSIPVIGVTGSVGKTTTKDMIAAVLSQKYKVLKTQGNFNNNIGLPKTIFNLDSSDEIAVFEMGMNHMGEIDYLVKIARPDVAVITNVGQSHIGNLGSQANIFRAKCEIFHGLRHGGTAVLNGDDRFLTTLKPGAEQIEEPGTLYTDIAAGGYTFHWVGESDGCDYRAEKIDDTLPDRVRFEAVMPPADSGGIRGENVSADRRSADINGTDSASSDRLRLEVPALGRHMIYSVLTAAAIGRQYGLSDEQIRAGVAGFGKTRTKMRMETEHCAHGITLINDTYNANPQSMKAALDILARTGAAHRVAVVGDMLELEPFAEKLHREVGAYAAGLPISVLVTVGPNAAYLAEAASEGGLKDVRVCADKEQAKEQLKDLVRPDTTLLFKASRGMALEELCGFCRAVSKKV